MRIEVILRRSGKAALLAAALCSAGCSIAPVGPDVHESKSVDRDKAEWVLVSLRMGAGELRIDGGTDKLATADVTYNVPEWKPEMKYSNSGGVGNLTISQPGEEGHSINIRGHQKNEWDIRLNKDVPLEFTGHMGAGEAHVNLGGLTLRGVELQLGAGELDLDLRGAPKASYSVRLQGGVGEATIHLPSGVGVEATAQGGIGSIEANGLHADGHRYYNDALGKSAVTVRLDVQGGVGEIRLISGN